MKRIIPMFVVFSLFFSCSACFTNKSEPLYIESSTQGPVTTQLKASNVDILIEQIKTGDFSVLTGIDDYESENLERLYANPYTELEWVVCSLNENGLKGLLRQEKDSRLGDMPNRIIAIFAIIDGEARLVCLTTDL